MSTRARTIDIPVDGKHLAGTLVGPDTLVPGVLLVHGWDGSQDQYVARAHEIATLGCICLTFDLRGHVRHEMQRETVSREDNLRDLLAAYDVLVGHPAVDPGAVAIVGSSYGGYLAAIASALRPVRWLGLRVPALYKDAGWHTPKSQLDRDELAAYRRTVVVPGANRALAACAAFRGDDGQNRLWVAGGAQGTVSVIDLNNGATLATLEGPKGTHTFINDLVPAADGYVYVTDSFRPVLFRARHAPGAPLVLEPWLDLGTTPIRYVPNEVNLNGIVAAPDGRSLLAIQMVTGQLWRIDIATRAVTPVRVDGGDLRHGDGLLVRGATDLYVVRNEADEVAQLQSTDGWASARVVRRITDPRLKHPTTAAASDRGLMVVNAQLDKLKDPPPLLPFDVVMLAWPR